MYLTKIFINVIMGTILIMEVLHISRNMRRLQNIMEKVVAQIPRYDSDHRPCSDF